MKNLSEIIFSKSSGVNDSIFGKSQEPIRAVVEQNVESFEKASMIERVYCMDTTDSFAEKYTSETSLGNFKPVGENGENPRTTFREGYAQVIEPDTWKNSFEVTQEMVEDAKMGKIRSKASAFTLSYNRTRELFAATMFAGGVGDTVAFEGKTYNTKAADGKPLFSTTHTSVTEGCADQSNLFDADFSYDALCYLEEAMQGYRDDDGNLLNIMPDTIVIPNSAKLKKAVFEAVGADGIPTTANHSMNYQLGRWNVVVWPYLPSVAGVTTGKNAWYLLDSQFNQAYMGLIWLDRVKLTVKSYIDETTDANIFKGRARFGVGFNNWRCAAMCGPGITGATALLPSV